MKYRILSQLIAILFIIHDIAGIFVRLSSNGGQALLIRKNCTTNWGYMCSSGRTSNNVAKIACKQLGYPAGGSADDSYIPTAQQERADSTLYGTIERFNGNIRCGPNDYQFGDSCNATVWSDYTCTSQGLRRVATVKCAGERTTEPVYQHSYEQIVQSHIEYIGVEDFGFSFNMTDLHRLNLLPAVNADQVWTVERGSNCDGEGSKPCANQLSVTRGSISKGEDDWKITVNDWGGPKTYVFVFGIWRIDCYKPFKYKTSVNISGVTPVRIIVASASESSPNTAVDIIWKPYPIPDTGTLTTVEIQLKEPGSGKVILTAHSTSTSQTLTDLLPGKYYHLQLIRKYGQDQSIATNATAITSPRTINHVRIELRERKIDIVIELPASSSTYFNRLRLLMSAMAPRTGEILYQNFTLAAEPRSRRHEFTTAINASLFNPYTAGKQYSVAVYTSTIGVGVTAESRSSVNATTVAAPLSPMSIQASYLKVQGKVKFTWRLRNRAHYSYVAIRYCEQSGGSTCSTPKKFNVRPGLREYTIDVNIFKSATRYRITATAISFGQEGPPSPPARFEYSAPCRLLSDANGKLADNTGIKNFFASGREFVIECRKGYFLKENAGNIWRCVRGQWSTSPKCYYKSNLFLVYIIGGSIVGIIIAIALIAYVATHCGKRERRRRALLQDPDLMQALRVKAYKQSLQRHSVIKGPRRGPRLDGSERLIDHNPSLRRTRRTSHFD